MTLLRQLVPALRLSAATLILTGVAYPLAMTGLAQILFPRAANGSLVPGDRGAIVGSELIGQRFASPAYFQPRPSSAGDGYDASASSGSNLGPTSRKLRERIQAEIARLRKENENAPGPVPADLVTASASGLDPHVSPAAARWQAPRVARARGVAVEMVMDLIAARTEGRTFGLLGEPRVNVLLLNLDLDRRLGSPARRDPS
jgi:potassium-transporting ATPase KdpC subunit